jgi:hypothetical protein
MREKHPTCPFYCGELLSCTHTKNTRERIQQKPSFPAVALARAVREKCATHPSYYGEPVSRERNKKNGPKPDMTIPPHAVPLFSAPQKTKPKNIFYISLHISGQI